MKDMVSFILQILSHRTTAIVMMLALVIAVIGPRKSMPKSIIVSCRVIAWLAALFGCFQAVDDEHRNFILLSTQLAILSHQNDYSVRAISLNDTWYQPMSRPLIAPGAVFVMIQVKRQHQPSGQLDCQQNFSVVSPPALNTGVDGRAGQVIDDAYEKTSGHSIHFNIPAPGLWLDDNPIHLFLKNDAGDLGPCSFTPDGEADEQTHAEDKAG